MTRPFGRWLSKPIFQSMPYAKRSKKWNGDLSTPISVAALSKSASPRRVEQKRKYPNTGGNKPIDRWFFIFGFEKNDRDNISAKELKALKLSADLLGLSSAQIATAITAKTIEETCHEN
jgi:hypothetical protein